MILVAMSSSSMVGGAKRFSTTTGTRLSSEIALWNGQEFPEGVYGFVFEGTRLSGEKVVCSGTVIFLR
jgi:hypothetical protein